MRLALTWISARAVVGLSSALLEDALLPGGDLDGLADPAERVMTAGRPR